MNFVPSAISLAEKASEAYNDLNVGRSVRLGTYKGANNVKKLGHYNSQGKRLGITHG